MNNKKPKYKPLLEAVDDLSLGISIVVAILLGVGIGYGLVYIFDTIWLFWVGIFWGIGGAILNIYKAYKRQIKSLQEYIEKEQKID